jgi:N-methylhydantoinase B/oxoprolinase/acetone carboxylase alpha subunit
MVLRKEFIADSAGAGKYRGSPGQRVVLARHPSHPQPLHVYFHPNRLSFAPEGVFGGQAGTRTRVIVNDEVRSDNPTAMTHGFVTLQHDTDRLVVEFPSGAGFGPPQERDPALVQRDVQNGLVTPHSARQDYSLSSGNQASSSTRARG